MHEYNGLWPCKDLNLKLTNKSKANEQLIKMIKRQDFFLKYLTYNNLNQWINKASNGKNKNLQATTTTK